MYPSVKQVAHRDDYTLFLVFDNGESGILDIKPMLDFGVFRRLKDLDAFRLVRVEFHTAVWDCGLDLAPEYLYEKCEKQSAE